MFGRVAEAQHDARKVLLGALDDGERPDFARMRTEYNNRETYYQHNMQNAKAEFLTDCVQSHPMCMFQHTRSGGNDVYVKKKLADLVENASDHVARDEDGTYWYIAKVSEKLAGPTHDRFRVPIPDDDQTVSFHMVAFCIEDGRCHYLDTRDQNKEFRLIAFVRDAVRRYDDSWYMLHNGNHRCPLERSLLRPSVPHPTTLRVDETVLTMTGRHLNESQREAIRGLSNVLNILEGPPGTGKSTTICEMLRVLKAERGSLRACVTSVTNKAIDSVSEKIIEAENPRLGWTTRRDGTQRFWHKTPRGLQVQVHDPREILALNRKYVNVLVMGNPARVCETARKLMLEAKIARDDVTGTVERGRGMFSRLCKEMEEIFTAGALHLLGGKEKAAPITLKGERLWTYYQARRTVDREVQDMHDAFPQPLSRVSRAQLLEQLQEVHQKRVTAIRWKMAVAFKKQKFPKTNRLMSTLRSCDAKLTELLSWARTTVERRILKGMNAFVFTIGSSHYYTGTLEVEAGSQDAPTPVLDLAIIDEAGATLESHIPVLLKLQVKNLVLLGDIKQLRPLVKSLNDTDVREKCVDRSCMERCIDAGVATHMLKVQYRMPARMCRVVSNLFYDGLLRTGDSKVADYRERDQVRWVECTEWESKVGKSTVNVGQTLAVLELLTSDPVLTRALQRREHIKVITMYKPQHTLLAKFVVERFPKQEHLQVCTVDASQGSEADHIVLVTSRSNRDGSIGFLKDRNRCCVAISRCKQTFTVVGNAATVGTCSMWSVVKRAATLEVGRTAENARAEVEEELEAMQRRAGPCGGKGGRDAKGNGKGTGKGTGKYGGHFGSYSGGYPGRVRF